MAFDAKQALLLVKQRKDMMPGISQKDDYLTARIQAACNSLERAGIHLTDSIDDLMLVVDMTVWQYNNRDQSGAMPEWLKQARRERWLQDGRIHRAEECAYDP